ncbi:MAG: HAD family hydrolase [Coprobacillus sp.]
MIKLIVCDMDGTILKQDNTFDEESFLKIEEKRKSGVEFMFATGRSFEMVEDLCKQKNIYSDLILNNGTQYRSYDGSKDIYYPMDKEPFIKVIDILKERGYHISIHTQLGKYIVEDIETYFQHHLAILMKNRSVKDVSEFPKAAFFTREGFLKNTHYVSDIEDMFKQGALPLKIDARHLDINQITDVDDMLKSIGAFHISSSYGENIEITSLVHDKGSMLKEVLKEKGLTIDEVATFGDGHNDVGMLDSFPYSFAPSNACNEAKEKATYALDESNEQAAVKKGIEILEKLNLL